MSTRRVKVPRIKPHKAQAAILKAMATAKARGIYTYVIRAGRQVGKTALARDTAIGVLLEGGSVGYWNPTYPDGKDIWKSFVTDLGGPDSPLIKVVNKSERRIVLVNGGELDMWSLDKDGSGRGFRYDLVILDEAAKAKNLQSSIDETIQATTLAKKGVIWVLSTPRGRGEFHDLFLEGKKKRSRTLSFHIPSFANPFLSRTYLLGIKNDLVRRGRRWVWEQEYLAKPADQGINPFDLKILDRQLQLELSNKPIVAWGLDLAKSKDWTVLIGLDEDKRIAAFERWQKLPWPETEDMIASYTSIAPDSPILLDSTGVGDPIFDHLLVRGLPVISFKFHETSRRHLLDQYMIDFAEGHSYVLDGQHYIELSKAEYTMSRNGKMKVIVPTPEHDDCMMSGALANKLADDLGFPTINVVAPVKEEATTTKRSTSRLSRLKGYS